MSKHHPSQEPFKEGIFLQKRYTMKTPMRVLSGIIEQEMAVINFYQIDSNFACETIYIPVEFLPEGAKVGDRLLISKAGDAREGGR